MRPVAGAVLMGPTASSLPCTRGCPHTGGPRFRLWRPSVSSRTVGRRVLVPRRDGFERVLADGAASLRPDPCERRWVSVTPNSCRSVQPLWQVFRTQVRGVVAEFGPAVAGSARVVTEVQVIHARSCRRRGKSARGSLETPAGLRRGKFWKELPCLGAGTSRLCPYTRRRLQPRGIR